MNNQLILISNRNKIKLTNKDSINLLNEYHLQELNDLNYNDNEINEIYSNKYNLIITSNNNRKIFNALIIDDSINIDNKIVKFRRHLYSFIQPDDTLRFFIHNVIYKYINNLRTNFDYGIFLGGECYIYGKIYNYLCENKIYITDTKSIYYDCILNDITYSSKYYLINYEKNKLDYLYSIKSNSFIISNVSKKGLGINLITEICKSYIKLLILIHCNSPCKDLQLLKFKYKLVKIFYYKTNYNIVVSILIRS